MEFDFIEGFLSGLFVGLLLASGVLYGVFIWTHSDIVSGDKP